MEKSDKSGNNFKRKGALAAVIVMGVAIAAVAGLLQFQRVEKKDDGQTETSKLREVENPTGRTNWFMYQRMFPFDKIPDGARRAAFDEVAARGEGFGPAGQANTWSPVGPMPTAGAGPGGAVSGRINEIAISPANNQLILVAGGTGGVWRSTNGGTSFSPVSDNQVDLAVGSIAFAPSDPNIVYAGMGDGDSGYFGTGVIKSTDAGASWTRVNNTSLPNKVRSTRVRVDPADPNKVYLSASTFLNAANCTGTGSDPRDCGDSAGVYVSTDGGVNWTKTRSGIANDLAIHPTNSQIIYAAISVAMPNTDPSGLYKSTDGGTTWNNVYTSPFNSTKDFRVAVTAASPDRVYIYLGDEGSNDRRLETSSDAGGTFTTRGAIGTTATGLDPGQFGYNTYLAADPSNADTVWVGSRDFFKSTDGGATFTNLNNSWIPPYTCATCFQENMQKVHTDQQSFAFEPGNSNTFYVGNDGGIFKTTNGGTSFTTLNSTLSLAQLYSVAIHPTNGNISYAGAQDNGSQRRTSGTNGWVEFTQTGDGGPSVINSVNPSIVYLGGTMGNLIRNTETGSPQTQVDIASAASFGAQNGRIGFFAPVVGNGVDERLYSGSWQLYICSDCSTAQGAATWTRTSDTDLTTGGTDTLRTIAVAKSNTSVIYTGSANGRVMRSTDNGGSWTDITAGLPMRSIASITVSPANPALVYLTVSGYGSVGHVFRSTDSGSTWTNISGNLPDIPTNAFLIDPQTPTTFFAGTDIGVFRSTDSGGSWSAFNTGLPPVPAMAFTAQATGKIQVATYGRGVFELGAAAPANLARSDFDGDGRTDLSVFRGGEGNWYLNRSTAGFSVVNWGTTGDKIVPGDFDGDRKTDFAIWRPSDVDGQPDFYLLRSSDSTVSGVAWGTTADMPVAADYDGDGKTDVAVWRQATGDFFVLQSESGSLRHYNFGINGDKPVPGDFEGDGKADFAVFRPSNGTWYIARSTDNAVVTTPWGVSSDIPVFADYDGDNKADIAVFRPSNGVWYIVRSSGGTSYVPWGTDGDIPSPGDYDGDGKSDQAIYRAGVWFVNGSTSGMSAATFGVDGDVPTPRNYLPQ
ncbi:MAG: hypothetical protein KIS76_10275 [Pyrinomonadaceae bacterium]|nr:hypothetical protein [Pyrinomonadaceae bacterium]